MSRKKELPDELAIGTPDIWSGLTQRQKEIQRLRLRGFSQEMIGKIFGISQPAIFKEIRKIKEVHRARGTSLDKDEYAGDIVTKFDEVEEKAWNLFYSAGPQKQKPGNSAVQLQALQLIGTLQSQKTKLLMELGVLHRAARRVEHEVGISTGQPTIIDKWDLQGRRKLAQHIIVSQLEPLAEPSPPEEGEIIEEPPGG